MNNMKERARWHDVLLPTALTRHVKSTLERTIPRGVREEEDFEVTMSKTTGKARPKAFLSIGEYLRKAGSFKTVNIYYNEIISTHPSVALSDNGDDEDVDDLTQGMIDAAQHGHLETLRFLAGKAQTGGEEGGLGTCIGERASSLMLHLAAEYGHDAIVRYLVEDLWVDVDAATVRGMTALHYAAKANRTAVVRELARLGADLEARNDCGQVPAQLTKDRLLRRLFQQYLGGGGSWGGAAPMVDRFVPPTASRVVDYVGIMTVKLAPQLLADSDKLSEVKQAIVCDVWRCPQTNHDDAPMPDASNLAEICTQSCDGQGGPLPSYGTLLTDTSGARSFVWSKVLGVYQDAGQRGRARVATTLVSSGEASPASVTAGEVTARVVLVLARRAYTFAYGAICDHIADLILEEAPKWGSLAEWSSDMDHERNEHIKYALEQYVTEMPLPLASRRAEYRVFDRVLTYGDAHASHSSLPHVEEADLACLTSNLGPDTILQALVCLLQEQSVLILSEKIEHLAPATTALLGLLFPLRWPHTLIPVLPVSLVHYLEAPVPFLMGMDQRSLDRVGADLSCITIVNLTTNKVILPIRPITSVTTVPAPQSVGGGDHGRRPSRRDSATRSLAELPTALRARAESRLRRCVPLEVAPMSDRAHHQPRASVLYTPGLRVAVADVMVELFGPYQNYRYVEGAQNRVISEAPADHRKLLQAIFSTQLWKIFRDDLRADEGDVSASAGWEEQAQLFCACIERARHRSSGGSAAAAGSHSCQDVLYPSEDVEEQLAQLSVYPEPDSIEEDDVADSPSTPNAGAAAEAAAEAAPDGALGKSEERETTGSWAAASAEAPLIIQEKTDEVLRSITTSFATVTDMWGGRTKDNSPSPVPTERVQREGATSEQKRSSTGGGSGGWDLFKPPSMSEMKRRLESAGVVGGDWSPTRATGGKHARDRTVDGGSLSPAREGDDSSGIDSGLAKIGESWRDLRRRSTEAMTDAVTKLRSALDDSDSDAGDGGRETSGGKVRPGKAKPRAEVDEFWRPFGDDGGDASDGGELGEPVVLPTEDEARRDRDGQAAVKRGGTSAQARLEAYYGGGS